MSKLRVVHSTSSSTAQLQLLSFIDFGEVVEQLDYEGIVEALSQQLEYLSEDVQEAGHELLKFMLEANEDRP